MWLLQSINLYIEQQGIAASRFGRTVLGDPNFVRDLRRGRMVKPGTEARVRAYLEGRGGATPRRSASTDSSSGRSRRGAGRR